MTASVTGSPRYSSASRLSLPSTRAEISCAVYFLSSISTDQSVPMWRLTEEIVRSTFVTACRLATSPTRTSPVLENATTDGVVRAPSAFAMTVGSPPSRTATTELVVPRSIPTARAMGGAFLTWVVRARGRRAILSQPGSSLRSRSRSRKFPGAKLSLYGSTLSSAGLFPRGTQVAVASGPRQSGDALGEHLPHAAPPVQDRPRLDEAALAEAVLGALPQPCGEVGAQGPQARPSLLGVQCVRDDLDRVGVLDERDRVRDVLPRRAALPVEAHLARVAEVARVALEQVSLGHRTADRPTAQHEHRLARVGVDRPQGRPDPETVDLVGPRPTVLETEDDDGFPAARGLPVAEASPARPPVHELGPEERRKHGKKSSECQPPHGSTLRQLGNAVVSSGRSARCRGRSTRARWSAETDARDPLGERATVTLAHREPHRVTLLEDVTTLDRRDVHEEVRTVVVGHDEPEAPVRVEARHDTLTAAPTARPARPWFARGRSAAAPGRPHETHLARLRAAVPRDDVEGHPVTLVELGEPTRERAHVHKDVGAAVVGSHETETLAGVEPRDRAVRAVRLPAARRRPRRIRAQRQDVVSLGALLPLDHEERDALPLGEHRATHDRRAVHEDLHAAVVGRDEAVALRRLV